MQNIFKIVLLHTERIGKIIEKDTGFQHLRRRHGKFNNLFNCYFSNDS